MRIPSYAAGPPGNGCLVRCFPIPRRIGYSPITLIARNRHYGPSAPITHSASFPFFSSVFCPRPQRCQKLPQSNRRSPRHCQKLPQSRSFQEEDSAGFGFGGFAYTPSGG
ncbi:hypothetical protein ES332_D12G231000v1 [Gossypium tomentosum]|uniref:Uncharacterized protein n=1 Tax=Gossypium tomentosum TaxID=34277 RepID=A0A5D2IDM5_GOSTO|nr:hypothetical protein ES332_D12G231000v1 [Gossypium tomentosum]